MVSVQEIGVIAGKVLPKDYVISINPDHPYLFVGPDLLVGGHGQLGAIFIPNVAEYSHPNKLLVRLAVSRLALPAHTRCILTVDMDRLPLGYVEEIRRNFNAVLNATEYDGLTSVLEPDYENDRTTRILNEISQRAYLRAVSYRKVGGYAAARAAA